MERINSQIDQGQEQSKNLFAETESTRDDRTADVFVKKVDDVQRVVSEAKLGPEAKRNLYENIDNFFREEISTLLPLKGPDIYTKAKGKLLELIGKGEEKRVDELVEKAGKLEEKVDDTVFDKEEAEAAEEEKTGTLKLAGEKAFSELQAVMKLRKNALEAMKSDDTLARINADFDLKESDKKLLTAIQNLTGAIDENNDADFSTERGVLMDSTRVLLSQMMAFDRHTNREAERAVLLAKVQKNEGMRQMLEGISTVLNQNPKAFEDFKNFDMWVETVGGDFAFTERFLEVDEATRAKVMLRIQAKVMYEKNKIDLVKAVGPEKSFLEGKIALADGNIYKASDKLKFFRKSLQDGKVNDPEGKLLEETESLLRSIGMQKATLVREDLSNLLTQRKQRNLIADWNPKIEQANKTLDKMMEDFSKGTLTTFDEAVTKYKGELGHDLMFKLVEADGESTRAGLVGEIVDNLDSYGGSTMAARRIFDDYLREDLEGVELDKDVMSNLRVQADRDAVKYSHEVEDAMRNEVKGMANQIENIDKQLLRTSPITDPEKYRTLKVTKEELVSNLGKYTDVEWVKENGDHAFRLRVNDYLKKEAVAARTQQVLDEHYKNLVRKHKYLALSQRVTGEAKDIVEKAIKMDDLRDEYGTFARDSINSGIDHTAQATFDVGTMVIGMGSGAVTKLAATKLLGRMIARGGVEGTLARGAVWAAQHVGEGFGSTAANSSLQAIALLSKGQDGSEAFDGFMKAWGQSALMFSSVSAGGSLFAKGFGKAPKFGESKLGWGAYQAGQISTEVAMMTMSEKAWQSGEMFLTGSADQRRVTLDSMGESYANVLKYRMGAKAWKSTSIGKKMYQAEDRILAEANQNVVNSQRLSDLSRARLARRNIAEEVEGGDAVENELEEARKVKKGSDDGKKRARENDLSRVGNARGEVRNSDFEEINSVDKEFAELSNLAKDSKTDVRDLIIGKYLGDILIPGAKISGKEIVKVDKMDNGEFKVYLAGMSLGMSYSPSKLRLILKLVEGPKDVMDKVNGLLEKANKGSLKIPPIPNFSETSKPDRGISLPPILGRSNDLSKGNRELDFSKKLRSFYRIDPRTNKPYTGKTIKERRAQAKDALKEIKQEIREQFKLLQNCAENAQKFLEKNPKASFEALKYEVLPIEVTSKLSPYQVQKAEFALKVLVERIEVYNKHLPLFKENPTGYAEKVFGLKPGTLKGPVEIMTEQGVIQVETTNDQDFAAISGIKQENLGKVMGFTAINLSTSELEGILTVSREPGNRRILIHEKKHLDNQLLFERYLVSKEIGIQKTSSDPLIRAQDEIIAYLADGELSLESIGEQLLAENFLYDYHKMKKQAAPTPELKDKMNKEWERHKREVRKMLNIANNVRDENGNVDIQLLSVVPAKLWKHFVNGNRPPLEMRELVYKPKESNLEESNVGDAITEARLEAPQSSGSLWGRLKEAGRRLLGERDQENQMEKLKRLENLSEEKVQMLAELFPKGIEISDFQQMNTGNCYFLAVLHSLKKHPVAPYLFAQMISKKNGGWEVTFPGEEPIFLKREDLDGQKVWDPKKRSFEYKRTVHGQLGDKLFDQAYARLRKKQIIEKDPGKKSHETRGLVGGGWMIDPMKDLLKEHILQEFDIGHGYDTLDKSYQKREVEKLLERFADNPKLFLLTVATPLKIETPFLREGGDEHGGDMYYMDPEYKFVQKHAYSVVAVDSQRRIVTIANPHDTNKKTFDITFEKFYQYFAVIQGIELKRNSINGAEFLRLPAVEGKFNQELRPNVPHEYRLGTLDKLELKLADMRVDCSIENGQLHISIEGQRYILGNGENRIIGRSDSSKQSMLVSGSHIKVEFKDGKVILTDLNSTNGSIVHKNPKEIKEDIEQLSSLKPNEDYNFTLTTTLKVLMGSADVSISRRLGGSIVIIYPIANGQTKSMHLPLGSSVTLGRETDSGLSPLVSGRHLQIINTSKNTVSLRDLGSTNGTKIIEKTIENPKVEEIKLTPKNPYSYEITEGRKLKIHLGRGYYFEAHPPRNGVITIYSSDPSQNIINLVPGQSMKLGANHYPNMPDTVSGNHAEIRNINGRLVIVDVGSTNGTYITYE